MILKKLFTENSKNPEKSFFSRKRRAGGEKKYRNTCTCYWKKSFFWGGEKENRKTEYWGVIQQPRITCLVWLFLFLLWKGTPKKVIFRRLGQEKVQLFLLGKGTPKKVVILRRLGQEKVQQESQKAWDWGGPDQLMDFPFRYGNPTWNQSFIGLPFYVRTIRVASSCPNTPSYFC